MRRIRRSSYYITGAFLVLGGTVALSFHELDQESKDRVRSECESRAASREDVQAVLLGILEKFPQSASVLKIEDQVRAGLKPIECS